MGDWLVSLAGTAEGARLATALALMSALAHAVFGALQKGRYDPWLTRGMIDGWIVIITAPIALFIVPWPDAQLAWLLAGAVVLHFAYKFTMAAAYERAAYTVVYPVVRGTGPLVTVIAASVFFGERFTAIQWAGVACLSGAILALAWRNLSEVIALFSFGGVMLATRLDKVGEAAVLRETSVVFAALIGWFILGEKVGPRRLALMALVALGAVIVETGA